MCTYNYNVYTIRQLIQRLYSATLETYYIKYISKIHYVLPQSLLRIR